MSRKLPRFINAYLDRHGKPRHYLRRRGRPQVAIPGVPWSKEFMDAYTAALTSTPPEGSAIGASRIAPGTIAALIVDYYRGPEFSALSETTQALYRSICEGIRAQYGDRRVAMLEYEHVRKLFAAKKDKKPSANAWLRILRTLMKLAVRLKLRSSDPTEGVRSYTLKGSIYTWTEEDIATFEAAYPIGTRARLALALLLYTGQRRSDGIRMGRQHVKNGHISVTQQKTSAKLSIPIHPTLATILAAAPPGHMTFLTTAQGRPFTAEGFGNWFRRTCRAIGLPACTPHGLRKAACRRLAEAGCTVHQIAAISGHRSLRELQKYTEAADQQRMAGQAMAVFEVPNLQTRLGETAEKQSKIKGQK
jgi:integrase